MSFDLPDLVGCLELTEAGPGEWEGPNLDIGYHRVFGGQILSQTMVAAGTVAPDKAVKSLHVLFPAEGDTARPVQYRVSALRDGRTFATVQAVAHQDERAIAAAVVSLHAPEDGLHRSDGPPAGVADPVPGRTDLGPMVPWETSIVGGIDLGDPAAGPPELAWWMRTPVVADDRLHPALLAHATDLTLIGTALRPFDGVSQAQSTVGLHTAVTSHTLWFHQPFRVDDWLLVVQSAPITAGSRSYGRGDVFSGDQLVASFAQEAMIRPQGPGR